MAALRSAWVGTATIVIMVATHLLVPQAEAAGECGRISLPAATASLLACRTAAANPTVKVPLACCSKVAALLKASPGCLCSVLLSPLAGKAGIKPQVAITIPKRCNIRTRPVGKKCGRYTLP